MLTFYIIAHDKKVFKKNVYGKVCIYNGKNNSSFFDGIIKKNKNLMPKMLLIVIY